MSARIFISYARSDGSAAAESLIQLLAANNHSAWQDLRELGPEETVWPQIEKALRTAEFLIVLITPAALKSDYIRKEWRAARRNGATIMPVMAMEQSRSTLPRWLRRGEVYDLAEPAHREKFLARLNTTGGTFRADWDAGLEIETFIARPRLFAQIKAQLLSETSEPVSLTSALQGRGGYGKSVLAGEIARDADIRDAYIDGVFWVSLGQDNPDVLGQINHLIRRISGAGGAPDVNTAAEELRRLLEKRDVLIILDDVWRRQDLYPFAKATGQGNATLLATTRKLDALPPSAQTIDISGMEPDEAVALLSYGLAPDAAEQQALSAFASDFWHWPQLLAIVNGLLRGRLRDGDTLMHALDTIADGGRRGVVPGHDERERTIANVMQMGIDDLDPADRERFRALAIVPEDTAIPVAIIAPLWGLSQYEAEEFARLLLDRRLIQSRDLSDPAVGARIRMHDDMLWYLGAITNEASKPDLHSALLGPHRPANGNWADLEKDRPALHYLWRHLLWHLERAGEFETANALRIDYAWIKAKLTLLGIDGLLTDYRPRPADRRAALVGNALQLSRHALEQDRAQLGFQLFGRLNYLKGNEFNSICEAARNDIPFFGPVAQRLNPPGRELMRMLGHEDTVTCVAFSPDGSRIVSGSGDSTLRLWDAATGEAVGEPLRGHRGLVSSVAFAPDGSRIVSGEKDGTLRLWDASTGAALGAPLRGHRGKVHSVAFAPDGRRIVSGGEDSTLRLWDAATGAALGAPLRGHEDDVQSVAFAPDGNRIVSGGLDHTLRLWDAATGAPLSEPRSGHRGPVYCVAFSPDGSRIVSGGDEGFGTLRLWDAATGAAPSEPLCGHEGWVLSVAFSPDSSCIVSGGEDNTLRLWDAATGAALAEPLRGHVGWVHSVAFAPDGNRIVSGGEDGALRLWDAATGAPLAEPLHGHDDCVLGVAFAPDGSRIVSGGWEGTLRLWDAATGTALGGGLRGHQGWVRSLAFSPDVSRIVSGGDDNTLRLWDAATGAALGEPLRGHKGWVSSIAFSPDSRRIVSGGEDSTLRLWDAATGAALSAPLRGHRGPVYCVAFSPDGGRIVSGGDDHTLRPWDAATGAPLGPPLRGLESWVLSVAFSPDGSHIVSGGGDGTLRLWGGTTGALKCTYHLDATVPSVAISSTHIAIGDALGNVHILRWKDSQ